MQSMHGNKRTMQSGGDEEAVEALRSEVAPLSSSMSHAQYFGKAHVKKINFDKEF